MNGKIFQAPCITIRGLTILSGRGRGGGRGAYFKAKYGGGGRGRGDHQSDHSSGAQINAHTGPRDWEQLQRDLRSIDAQQYGAYKRLLGRYDHAGPAFTLSVDHVQSDAYAPPSRVRAIMPLTQTGFPQEYLNSPIRRIALCDYVTRAAASIIRAKHLDENVGSSNGGWSAPKGGAFNINAAGQEVLPRTSAMINGTETIELRFTAALPAAGRTVLGQQAHQILAVNLVELIKHSLLHANLDHVKLKKHITSVENQHHLREQLGDRGLVAFIADGSILPRASGASQAAMKTQDTIPFASPKELKVSFTLADGSTVSGMGIPKGITLLTGGGFHGKSTLLEAIELGVYDHIPGDGRELVVTDPTAIKIRAEDGRSVTGTDISPFISTLPGRKNTKIFSTDDASGSTSMAANIQEALEAGSKSLLIDEDSSATNLLVRDQRMQALIQNEPITPLVSKVRALYQQHGVSTIMVVGGLGDWLAVADQIIAMDSYVPHLITDQAHAILQQYPSEVVQDKKYGSLPSRSLQVRLSGEIAAHHASKTFIGIKSQAKNAVADPSQAPQGIDLQGLDQVVEAGQAKMVATSIQRFASAQG